MRHLVTLLTVLCVCLSPVSGLTEQPIDQGEPGPVLMPEELVPVPSDSVENLRVDPVDGEKIFDQQPVPVEENPHFPGTAQRSSMIRVGTGQLDPTALERSMQRLTYSIRRCYEAAMLKRNQTFRGQLSLRFTISLQGKAQDLSIESAINDRGMIRCIKTAALRNRFPRPSNGIVLIKQPFELRPKE